MTRAHLFLSVLLAAALLAFPAVLLLAAPAMAQRPLTLAQYDHALAPVETLARRAAAGDADAARSAMTAIEPILRCAVDIDGRSLVLADNRPILAQMQGAQLASPSARSARWSEIAGEIASIAGTPPAANAGKAQSAVASAAAVLSSAEFRSDPLPSTSMWDRIGDWIARELAKIHIHFPHWRWPHMKAVPDSITAQLPELILIVILVFAIGLIVTFLIQWWRNRVAGADVASDSSLAMTLEERELVATHNFGRLRELARQAAGRGDHRSAFRLVFLAILVFLDAEGAIKLDRSKTNWEYLRLLGDFPEVRERLTPLAGDFDRIWYGEQSATEADFARADARFDEIRQAISSWRAGSAGISGLNSSFGKAAQTL